MIREPRREKTGGTTHSQSQDIARSVWLGQQRRRENGKYRLWGAFLKSGPRHAKNMRAVAPTRKTSVGWRWQGHR
jgi:hypothetical protein